MIRQKGGGGRELNCVYKLAEIELSLIDVRKLQSTKKKKKTTIIYSCSEEKNKKKKRTMRERKLPLLEAVLGLMSSCSRSLSLVGWEVEGAGLAIV